MFDDDSSSWLDDIGGVLGITPPAAEESSPPSEDTAGGNDESGWFDRATDYVSEAVDDAASLFTDEQQQTPPLGLYGEDELPLGVEEDEEEAQTGSVEGRTGETAHDQQEEPSWYDRASDYVSEVVDDVADLFGGEEEGVDEDDDAIPSILGFIGNEDEGEEIAVPSGDDDDTASDNPEDDLWWHDLLAVTARAGRLNEQMDNLWRAAKPGETPEGKFADPEKRALQEDIATMNQECTNVKLSWGTFSEAEHEDIVINLENFAAELEILMQQYLGEIEEHDKKQEDQEGKLAAIARSLQPIQGAVYTAESILKITQQKVERTKESIDNQRLVARVNAAMGTINILLSAYPPTSILGTGMSLVQMGMEPSESGAVGLSSSLAKCVTKSMKFTSKMAGAVGTIASVAGFVDQCIEDRDKYYALYQRLQERLHDVSRAAQELNRLMVQFKTELARAQQLVNRVTGT